MRAHVCSWADAACGLSRSGVAFGLVALTALRRVLPRFSLLQPQNGCRNLCICHSGTNAAPLRVSLYSCVSLSCCS